MCAKEGYARGVWNGGVGRGACAQGGVQGGCAWGVRKGRVCLCKGEVCKEGACTREHVCVSGCVPTGGVQRGLRVHRGMHWGCMLGGVRGEECLCNEGVQEEYACVHRWGVQRRACACKGSVGVRGCVCNRSVCARGRHLSVQGGVNERASVSAKGSVCARGTVCVRGAACNGKCVKGEHIGARVCAQGSTCERATGRVCKGCVFTAG